MVSILVVVIVCTLFYCVYCWRWRKRKRNGELALAFTFRSFVSNIYGAVVAFALDACAYSCCAGRRHARVRLVVMTIES